MESSCGDSFIVHKKKYEKGKGLVYSFIFPEVPCFARSSWRKRMAE